MKLNHDCVRDMLLLIEHNLDLNPISLNKTIDNDKSFVSNPETLNFIYEKNTMFYTVLKLMESGYISGKSIDSDQQKALDIRISSLTWEGHQFLDNIRDPKVWRKAKKELSKFKSVSVKIIGSVAANVLTKMIY